MEDDFLQSFAKLFGLIQQLIKQVEDLQDLVAEQQTLLVQFQTDLEKLTKTKIHLNQVFVFKKSPFPITEKPLSKSSPNFWLPQISDPTTQGAKN